MAHDTRMVTNVTKRSLVLRDINAPIGTELLPGKNTDLLIISNLEEIGKSEDLRIAVKNGWVKFQNRDKKVIKKNKIDTAITIAVLNDITPTPASTELIRNFREVTGDYTLNVNDDDIIIADATDAELTITLPSAVGISGYHFIVKRINSGSNNVILAAASGETIDGDSTQTLATQYISLTIASDGDEWFII